MRRAGYKKKAALDWHSRHHVDRIGAQPDVVFHSLPPSLASTVKVMRKQSRSFFLAVPTMGLLSSRSTMNSCRDVKLLFPARCIILIFRTFSVCPSRGQWGMIFKAVFVAACEVTGCCLMWQHWVCLSSRMAAWMCLQRGGMRQWQPLGLSFQPHGYMDVLAEVACGNDLSFHPPPWCGDPMPE
jgi:hypothetical protein